MVSMTLATFAMAVWGCALVWKRVAPEGSPGFQAVFLVSCLFAIPGLLLGMLTLRARFGWMMLALVPIGANGMALALPWIALKLQLFGGP